MREGADPNGAPVMFGIYLSVAADLVSPIGIGLQKIAHRRNGDRVHRSPLWWLGVLVHVLSEIGNGVAYGDERIPTSSITAVGCVGVLSNAVVARFFLRERLDGSHLLGGALIAWGVVQIVVFTPQRDDPLTETQMRELALGPTALVVYGTLLAALTGSAAAIRCAALRPILWLVPSALAGSFTVIAARYSFGQLVLHASGATDDDLGALGTDPVFYVSLAVVLLVGALQIVLFNLALARSDAALVTPLFYVLFTLCASLTAAAVYDEYREGSPTEWALLVNAFIICGIGIGILVRRRAAAEEEEEAAAPIA